MHMNLVWVLDVQSYLQYATKIKLLPNHPAHNAVFDNTYMKLFDARPSAIPTFGLHMKQFLTASNIDFSDILETPSYFILTTLVYQTTEDCAGSGASDKRSNRCINIPATFFGNSRQVPWLHSCLYRRITGWEFCGLSYSFHRTPNFPWGCPIRHLFSLPKFGQSLKPWMKWKTHLHPNS